LQIKQVLAQIQYPKYFLEGLNTLQKFFILAEERSVGLSVILDFAIDKKTRIVFLLDRLNCIVHRARQKGFTAKTTGHALEIDPPLTIRKKNGCGRHDIGTLPAAEIKEMGMLNPFMPCLSERRWCTRL